MIIKKEKKILKVLKDIGNILTWTVLSLLIGIIMFLVFVVVTTKVSEKNGARPIFGLYTIVSPSMVPNINVYDVVFVAQTNTKKLEVGNVISFYVSNNAMLSATPVTHRIAEKVLSSTGEYAFKTKGDNNDMKDDWTIYEKDVLGKVIFKIPQLGRVQFFLASKTGWFIIILIPALVIIAYDLFKILKLILLKNKINDERKQEIKISNNINVNNSQTSNNNDYMKEFQDITNLDEKKDENNNIQ